MNQYILIKYDNNFCITEKLKFTKRIKLQNHLNITSNQLHYLIYYKKTHLNMMNMNMIVVSSKHSQFDAIDKMSNDKLSTVLKLRNKYENNYALLSDKEKEFYLNFLYF